MTGRNSDGACRATCQACAPSTAPSGAARRCRLRSRERGKCNSRGGHRDFDCWVAPQPYPEPRWPPPSGTTYDALRRAGLRPSRLENIKNLHHSRGHQPRCPRTKARGRGPGGTRICPPDASASERAPRSRCRTPQGHRCPQTKVRGWRPRGPVTARLHECLRARTVDGAERVRPQGYRVPQNGGSRLGPRGPRCDCVRRRLRPRPTQSSASCTPLLVPSPRFTAPRAKPPCFGATIVTLPGRTGPLAQSESTNPSSACSLRNVQHHQAQRHWI